MSDSGIETEQNTGDEMATRHGSEVPRSEELDEVVEEATAETSLVDGDEEEAAVDSDEHHSTVEVADLQDQLLRKQADFENFRRRLHRDKDEAIRYANTDVLLDLADVIDGLERAIQAGADADVDSLRDGVSLIEKQLTGLLERKWGFCRFTSEGEPFDPDRHQAIVSEESDSCQVATVVEDYQSGYLLHDRVVRPARVKVEQPRSGLNEDPEDADGDAPAEETHINPDSAVNTDKEGE